MPSLKPTLIAGGNLNDLKLALTPFVDVIRHPGMFWAVIHVPPPLAARAPVA